MTLKVIAYARNGHTDKFGIPRQSREESPILTRIVFEPEYAVKEALRGIEGYSHLWLLWGFSETSRSRDSETSKEGNEALDWSPTVRPPRLGGNTRMGVFATRSPFRPNPIGLSSVKLIKIENGDLIVSGADVMDGTPIYDIKPYLSFSDSHEDARNGFAEETKYRTLKVNHIETPSGMTDEKLKEISYILSQDPRPGYQDDPEREYKMDYAGWCVTFRVQDGTVFVEKIEKTQK
jgi:tRNA-Thr(GGU) m(6)t(6)A37 methyltransferase TsaA